MIISIDGPAGSGKSTVADVLAKRLGFIHFNSGSLYRAITAHILKNHIDVNTVSDDILHLNTEIIDGVQRVYVNGIDYTGSLRDNEVSTHTASVSCNRIVRNIVDNCQRNFCSQHNVVIDGRDIGSFVFPNAEVKFYLDCDLRVRAERRFKEEVAKNPNITLDEIMSQLNERDNIDKSKSIAPLVVPKDAIIINSTNLNIDEVVNLMLTYVKKNN